MIFINILLFGSLQIKYFLDRESNLGCVDILLNGKISLLKIKTLVVDDDIWYQIGKQDLKRIGQSKLMSKLVGKNKAKANLNWDNKKEKENSKENSQNKYVRKPKLSKIFDAFLPLGKSSSKLNVYYDNVDCMQCAIVVGMASVSKEIYSKVFAKIFAGENNLDIVSSFEDADQLKINGRVDIHFGVAQIIFRLLRMLIFRRRYYG